MENRLKNKLEKMLIFDQKILVMLTINVSSMTLILGQPRTARTWTSFEDLLLTIILELTFDFLSSKLFEYIQFQVIIN